MGGSSGGGLSQVDLSKLTRMAEDRIRQLAQSGTQILFACEADDRKALEAHLDRSKVFDPKKYVLVDSSAGDSATAKIDKVSMVIVFTESTKKTSFLDGIIQSTVRKKKQGVHGKGKSNSLIPPQATALRWPSLEWSKLEEIFK